jgi:flavin-dependent dehydrogenase
LEDVIVIGGGLAGLISAIQLGRGGLKVLVIEKKAYPFHRVCGEYISNEVLPFFLRIGFDPRTLGASNITRLNISAPSGKLLQLPLTSGGFGLSRYVLDKHLYSLALSSGADFLLNTHVSEVIFKDDHFEIILNDGTMRTSRLVIGSFGKRSNLDRQLNREFFKKKSPYLGVKYHIRTGHPADLISLHIFKDGYCGISKIENDTYCLCYLSLAKNLKKYESISSMEKEVLCRNPHLKKIFNNAEFVFPKPEVINEISFEKKTTVENHILMTGDAVGMISPLCGNGMAMAIHSAKMVSEIILENIHRSNYTRMDIEHSYQSAWKQTFGSRIWIGRRIQEVFGNEHLTKAGIYLLKQYPFLGRHLVDLTHGKPF